ncbi:trypsin-like peptidase domain-containing protein [Ramlibacter sp. RBP-2]|uniref:Trypsin-like peptidase domain-containing protein n=1 Tax=Ramlibacter lithotrophicus TaxID=2606681 RepID=A0A7X6DH82_9BURK|nr:serine protease [Ramlibacter lithotrophicus]NKE67127.1 trypsin-like peptidase domain-containing protein [Ramlibacter lithotrophicus]
MQEKQEWSVLSGFFGDDPTAGAPRGMTMAFRSLPIQPVFTEVSCSLRNWDFFQGVLLCMTFADKENHRVEGSAVLVAPGIALCATHVIEPYLEALLSSESVVMCQGFTPHGLQIWQIRKVTTAPDSDVAILGLVLASALPPGHEFLQAAITTRMPSVGEEFVICGFRAAEEAFPTPAAWATIQIEGEVRLSRGLISETYPLGRDRAMLPWPVVEVTCPTVGGMSGGPVFDARGRLVGLLCSSMDTEDGSGVSYVSLLWPVLPRKFEAVWPANFFDGSVSLLDMDPRLCSIDKREALSLEPHPSGSGTRTAYKVWT